MLLACGGDVRARALRTIVCRRDVRGEPNEVGAIVTRAMVLSGCIGALWDAGPRSAAERKEAATLFERAAALTGAPGQKAALAGAALACRSL